MNNCWLHGTGQEIESNKKLKTVEITRQGDYANNLRLILAPNEEDQKTLKQLQEEKAKNSQLEAELNAKDQRLAQLDRIIKGSVFIFQKQQVVIDQLTSKLKKEITKNVGNADYQQHLQVDLLRLAEERKELTKRLKEFSEEEQKSKNIRDQQISDLRQEKAQLEKTIKEMKPKCLTDEEFEEAKRLRELSKQFSALGAFPRRKDKEIVNRLKELIPSIKLKITTYPLLGSIYGFESLFVLKLFKLYDGLKQEINEMKPRCLSDEEFGIAKVQRDCWDLDWFDVDMAHGSNDNQENRDKFYKMVEDANNKIRFPIKPSDFSKLASKVETYPLLGASYKLWLFIIPSLLAIIDKYKTELAKERGWWDKWINDGKDFIVSTDNERDYHVRANFPNGEDLNIANVYYLDKGYATERTICLTYFGKMEGHWSPDASDIVDLQIIPTKFCFNQGKRSELKKTIKEKIYQYYLDLK